MADKAPLKLLCVTAHPDDECFAFGGALMLAHKAGVETTVLCFTDGQAATNRGVAVSGEHLGEMRRREFLASCKILDVTHAEILDYQDAQLEFADFSATAARLVERIRRDKPDVVLTFGSEISGAILSGSYRPISTFAWCAATSQAALSKKGSPLNLASPWLPSITSR